MAKWNIINVRKLVRLVNKVALVNGLKPPTQQEIVSEYFAPEVKRIPIIKRCNNGMLWVDRFYVAYQIDDGEVHYVYISEHHIAEEVNGYRIASHERNEDMQLPKDVRRCFRTAMTYMDKTGTKFWVDSNYQDTADASDGVNKTEQACAV